MTTDDLTPEERRVIEEVAERKGRDWAEDHAQLILDQARLVGELGPEDRSD